MVGHIVLQVPNEGGNVTICTTVRPRPHQPYATDHVIGLAAEFGCGLRGALCRATGLPLATNGVMGYGDAGRGGSFLKIGVGKLLRPDKLRTDGFAYNFTWPYDVARPLPTWKVDAFSDGSGVILQQTVRYKRWGWALRRKIYVCTPTGKHPTLCVDLRVTNLGESTLRTPYTSGNAFNMLRGPATGPGFAVAFNVPGSARFYDHANVTAPWTVPIAHLADLTLRRGTGASRISVNRRVGEHEYASANFDVVNSSWDGGFSVTLPAASGWSLTVRHALWRDHAARRSGWFGFNVKVGRRAISPRPFLLLDLEPKQSVDISHRYEFVWRPVF
eukprot:CAMPEP_0115870516 /NCGR_PEP_ID=MMETSP0287-20121206/22368_1 /TAXON_ID=412157 /ORGANISM="Chrysochromulina rotalis, Strain UIO044" /LENGTH=330 /DNA_ID=CAMNT_0003325243 /DNA_START=252 /DNA_END=1244 /DNA_ORIENTATION=-